MKENFSLIVNKLSCRRNSSILFKPISFRVLKGQLLIIKGPNGKGKTTLLHCLGGILPFKGKVEWKVKKKRIGYVGHKIGLKDNETVEEFLRFWREIYNSELSIDFIIKMFSLTKLLYLPIGLLSFGQKKKLAFVRLFLMDSKIWLLDEPFSGMDFLNRKLIIGMIRNHLIKNGTIILSTHEPGKILNIKRIKEIVIV